MNKTTKEMATELFQYFEEGNVQKIVSLLNDCNKDELFDKARYSVDVYRRGILQVNNDHFANEEDFDDLSMSDKVAKLTEYIRQECWEECIELVTKNHDCAWEKHPAIKHTIESKVNEIKLRIKTRVDLLADAIKEPEVSKSESEPDDFELVGMDEEDFELAEEQKEGFVMVGKSDGALDKLNISNHLNPELSK